MSPQPTRDDEYGFARVQRLAIEHLLGVPLIRPFVHDRW